ncbi:MAG: hypothetical protein ACRD08_00235, partial [Acidimicrobiales bacterium]
MRRVAALAIALVVVPACTDDESAAQPERSSPGPDSAAAVEIVTEELLAVPRADFRADDEARCVATQVVAEIGLDRLEEVGLDLETETPPTLWQPELTEAEGDMVYWAYDDCLDLARRDVEGFMTDGLTEAQARCVSQGYRGSGIPRVHMLEPPHGNTLGPDRVAAHEDP